MSGMGLEIDRIFARIEVQDLAVAYRIRYNELREAHPDQTVFPEDDKLNLISYELDIAARSERLLYPEEGKWQSSR